MSQQDQVAGRFQQCLPVLATLALGLWIAYESFTVEDPQPYLFPQLISVAMIGLSAAALFRAIRGANPMSIAIRQPHPNIITRSFFALRNYLVGQPVNPALKTNS